MTRRRCAEKKDGSRSRTKWSIHFFQLSLRVRTTDSQGERKKEKERKSERGRGRKEGRRRGGRRLTSDGKDIRHLRGKTVWPEWYLEQRLSVKAARELCSDKAVPDVTLYTSNYRRILPAALRGGAFNFDRARSLGVRVFALRAAAIFLPFVAHHATSSADRGIWRIRELTRERIRATLHCASRLWEYGRFYRDRNEN